jgi:2-polyprenyl-6-methoxyphenol hydroxylase-like FAD-dependent oxidoreductase
MRVLVIGAGPTGLSLSLALRRRGIGCRLVEQEAERSQHSKALGVQARTLEVMERLGLADRFLAAAHPIGGVAMHGVGAAVRRIDFAPVHPRFPPVVILPQWETERLLAEAGAAPERRVTFIGLEGRGAWLSHPDGRREFFDADWIVGCDGAHSAVRHALEVDFAGERYPAEVMLVDCRLEGLEPDRIHVLPGQDRLQAFFPCPQGIWRAIALLPPGSPVPAEPTLAPFAAPGVRLSDPIWFSAFHISHRQVERYRHGRVLLAGDAAHIHSPAGGQGMNLGIQDSWALAAAIAQGEEAVDAWAAERHAIGRRVLAATDAATRMMTGHVPMPGLLRRVAFGLLGGVPLLRRRLTRAVAGLDYPAPAP